MFGTYAISAKGKTFVFSREEVDRLVNQGTLGMRYRLTNLVTMRSVVFDDRRPLTFEAIARISNEEA